MNEIRCIAEVHYFNQTFDAAISNLMLYEYVAYKASNFNSEKIGIPCLITYAQEYISLYGSDSNRPVFARLLVNEAIFKKWQEIVLTPIQERIANAVKNKVFEPYSSIKSVLGSQLNLGLLCIITDYLDTSLNRKYHNVYAQMHKLRFDAVSEKPNGTLTIAWDKFHKANTKEKESKVSNSNKTNEKTNNKKDDTELDIYIEEQNQLLKNLKI